MSAGATTDRPDLERSDRCSVIRIVCRYLQPPWRLGCSTMKTTLCWVELGVPDVAEVDGTNSEVGLRHALQRPLLTRSRNTTARADTPPQDRQAECEGRRRSHHRYEHQFAVATKQEIWPIG